MNLLLRPLCDMSDRWKWNFGEPLEEENGKDECGDSGTGGIF